MIARHSGFTRAIVALAPALALAFAASVPGCKNAEGTALPPASGSGAAPAPSIPKLESVGAPESTAAGKRSEVWTGTLRAVHEAQLGPKMTGILSDISVDEGDRVKKGQMLFRLDAVQAGLGVSQAKAALASAEVAASSANLEFGRATELIKGGSIAPAVYDQAKSAHDRAASGVDQAKVALQLAQRGASDTAVYSPIDGVVTAKMKNTGETVTMMPPTVVLVVQNVEKLEMRARLPEKALAKVREGTELELTATSVGQKRRVPVKRVNPTIDPRTRTVEVVAEVDNKDGRLKVGMFVEVAVAGEDTAAAPPAASADGRKAEAKVP